MDCLLSLVVPLVGGSLPGFGEGERVLGDLGSARFDRLAGFSGGEKPLESCSSKEAGLLRS